MNGEYVGAKKSNTTLEQLELLEHWKNPVLLLMKQKNIVINGVIEIYLTTDRLDERMKPVEDKSEYAYCQLTCIQAVDAAINLECEGLMIGGLAPEDLYITREDLSIIKEPVAGIIKLMEVVSEATSRSQAFREMQEMELYLLGKLDGEDEEMDMMRGDGDVCDRVKVFMTREHAEQENTRNFEINKYPLKEIIAHIQGRYALAIEPYEEYAVIFKKEEIKEFM